MIAPIESHLGLYPEHGLQLRSKLAIYFSVAFQRCLFRIATCESWTDILLFLQY
jgi:hypothetical protein